MSRTVFIEPLTKEAFSPYGDIIDAEGDPTVIINQGMCARYHDQALLSFASGGRAGISVFAGQPYSLPHRVAMMERHPLGSQTFIPMSDAPFLVVVAADKADKPVSPKAFLTRRQQGINIHRNVWHGVLTPLNAPARFAVVDWIGSENNLDEHVFADAFVVQLPA